MNLVAQLLTETTGHWIFGFKDLLIDNDIFINKSYPITILTDVKDIKFNNKFTAIRKHLIFTPDGLVFLLIDHIECSSGLRNEGWFDTSMLEIDINEFLFQCTLTEVDCGKVANKAFLVTPIVKDNLPNDVSHEMLLKDINPLETFFYFT